MEKVVPRLPMLPGHSYRGLWEKQSRDTKKTKKNIVPLLIVHNNGEAGLAVQFKQMQNKKILQFILTFFFYKQTLTHYLPGLF